MIISCIGDSLTEGDYGVFGKSGIADLREKNYPYFLQLLSGATVRNFGKCGYTSSSYLKNFDANGVKVEGSDVIIIMLGTNGGLKIDEPNYQGNLDYIELVKVCKMRAPSAKIFLCTPPHATQNPKRSNFGYAKQAEEGAEFVRSFAKENDLFLVDTAACPDFTDKNEDIMQPNDGLHFGEIGYYILAKFIFEGIKSYI